MSELPLPVVGSVWRSNTGQFVLIHYVEDARICIRYFGDDSRPIWTQDIWLDWSRDAACLWSPSQGQPQPQQPSEPPAGTVRELTDELIAEMIEESKKYDSCMALTVSEIGSSVELCLDTSVSTYNESIPGEGGDIGLIRCMETKRVMGIRLPLLRKNLCMQHDGPIRINAGFRKGEML